MTAEIEKLNKKLADFPYLEGYTPSQTDVVEFAKYAKFVHFNRWMKHMASFSDAEKKAFPSSQKSSKGPVPAPTQAKAPAPASAQPAKKGGDDDDDFDLFGSDDDEEAEKAKAERAKQMEAQKKGGKPGVVAKSQVVLDVKVWDDETDLKEVENEVRKIEKEGLLWGVAKTVPLAFGISKLQIVCVVEDEKVSIDWLSEKIEELELVQSTDIAAFQKI